MFFKTFSIISFHLCYVNCYMILWDNSIKVDFNDIQMQGRGDQLRLPNEFLIFPGTKWCGAGNIASNDSDFGEKRDTDKCCRNHDYCPDIIEAYQMNYGLENPSFYTRLNCKCDTEFYQCLKSVNSSTSNQVGHLYFTLLGTQCFKEDYPIMGCKKYTYFPCKKCVEYIRDEKQTKLYQWFDVPNF